MTEKPLREHFEVDTDAGTTLRTFDYIDALEKYIDQIQAKAEAWDVLNVKMDKFYEDGSGADLVDIGEAAAEAFGYL